MRGIPILCYHRIGGPLELGVTRVGRSVFARQMTALAKAGWRTLTLHEFVAAPHAARNAFLLTFDDGYNALAEHAFPVLADLGFTATTFLITDYVGRTNTWDIRYTWDRLPHLTWHDIEHWRARGFDFGSHGGTHRRLTWLDDVEVQAELARSRDALRARLGPDAGRAIAYPFGAVDARIVRHAAAAGYVLGFGGVKTSGERLNLARVPVYCWDRWDVPFGLRDDVLGSAGRLIAHAANRCAVGTSVMLKLRGVGSGERFSPVQGIVPLPTPHSLTKQRTAPLPESVADA
jgi:peptidoglycan/xylan/chitin deacetylase (PgdA/CDA1 family)